MCRNIRTLFNFDPPATDAEIRAASVQFVRKLSGFTKPSQANQAVFDVAVDEVAGVARRLIDSLVTHAPPATARNGRHARERAPPSGTGPRDLIDRGVGLARREHELVAVGILHHGKGAPRLALRAG